MATKPFIWGDDVERLKALATAANFPVQITRYHLTSGETQIIDCGPVTRAAAPLGAFAAMRAILFTAALTACSLFVAHALTQL